MRKNLTTTANLIGDGGIDPTDPLLVTKSMYTHVNGAPVTVSRQFIEMQGSAMADFRQGSGEAEYFNLGNGNDTAFGGGGDDLMDGGAGNDKLFGDAGNDDLRGGAGLDSLFGGIGDDVLNGGADLDWLAGGAGNDLYMVYGAMDTIVENANEGIDTLYTNVRFTTLPANVERLVADSSQLSAGVSFKGNALNNTLVGSSFSDTLDGGTGIDYMSGGLGNDHYRVDHLLDAVVESDTSAAGGVDTVTSLLDFYSLPAGVEQLYFEVAAGVGVTGLGNAWDNKIVGTSSNDWLKGMDGDDVLAGGAGNDTMEGGKGNDIFMSADAGDVIVETWGGGWDMVTTNAASFTLPNYVEELQFDIGFANGQVVGPVHFKGIGSEQTNEITGNIGNDTLEGRGGNDTLDGGQGDDQLSGGSGNDSLIGGDGIDQMDGGTGNDTMVGGNGHDAYHVDSVGDIVIEMANAGDDSVTTTLPSYTLPANVEHLFLSTQAGQQGVGIGNALNNAISGLAGNDLLQGGAGADTLVGGAGSDTLEGGTGADLFVATGSPLLPGSSMGHDTVLDFTPGSDRIGLFTLDAIPATPAKDFIAYLADGAFTGGGVASVRAELTGFGVQVQIDLDGDAAADAFMDLMGMATLPTMDDFMF